MPPVQLLMLLSWSMTSLVPDLHLYFTALAFARSKNTDAASSVSDGGRYRFAISLASERSLFRREVSPAKTRKRKGKRCGSAETSLLARWGSEMEPSLVRS